LFNVVNFLRYWDSLAGSLLPLEFTPVEVPMSRLVEEVAPDDTPDVLELSVEAALELINESQSYIRRFLG
jgi:hypothetical protein